VLDSPAKIYGIDLGTTYSCIAYVDEYGKPVVLKNMEGDNTTPSVVQFDGEARIVGKEAKNVAQLYPDSVVAMVKRHMGTGWRHTYQDKSYTPEEISSYVLRKLVGDVEAQTQEKVTDVVITCPAYFGVAERKATETAGELAGLKVRCILNEPTAAALAYGMNQEKDMRVLVYDLGGGTFDITSIAITAEAIEVLATGGNPNLGGRDWDADIVSYLSEQWKEATQSSDDPMDSPESLNKLFLDAESMKRSLSAPGREKVEIAVTHAGQVAKVALTRAKFEELTLPRLEETIAHTHKTLKEAKIKLEQAGKPTGVMFDRLLLVGGSTRMPQVARRLKEEFKIEPQMFDPDESVAKGAALYGQKLLIGEHLKTILESKGFNEGAAVPETVKDAAIKEVAEVFGLPAPAVKNIEARKARNVTSRSFGVVTRVKQTNEEKVRNLIKKNDTVPLKLTERFGTVEADQQGVAIKVMENMDMAAMATVADSKEIGTAELSLPAGLPENAPIEITFSLDEAGLLHVTGFDPAAKRTIEAEFQVAGVMTEEETQVAKARSKSLSIS
jgi:molecular chaperone DnaK